MILYNIINRNLTGQENSVNRIGCIRCAFEHHLQIKCGYKTIANLLDAFNGTTSHSFSDSSCLFQKQTSKQNTSPKLSKTPKA